MSPTTLEVGVSCAILLMNNLKKILVKVNLTWQDKKYVFVLSLLFTFFIIFGESFYLTNSWELVFGSIQTLRVSFIKGIMYFGGFYGILYVIWSFLLSSEKTIKLENQKYITDSKVHNYKNNHLFLYPFILLSLLYLPHLIAYYPGMFIGDTHALIFQGFGLPEYTSESINLIDDMVRVNQHHSVIHTMLIHSCLLIGKYFGNWSMGYFIYTVIQFFTMITAMSYCLCVLREHQINKKIYILIFTYFLAMPEIRNYLLLGTKDVMNGAFYLMFIVSLGQMFFLNDIDKQKGRDKVIFIVSIVGMLMFRNDSKIIICSAFFLFSIFFKRFRKEFISLIVVIIFGMMLYAAVLSAFKISPGSIREYFSIPFQQTARYLRDVPESEITQEEKDAISRILDYEYIKENYEPELSDPVKDTFNKNATAKELRAYFKVWGKMFFKHPGIYIQATMNNVYDYFYPGGRLAALYAENPTAEFMHYTNGTFPKMEFDFQYTQLQSCKLYRMLTELYYAFCFNCPVFKIVLSPAFYTWSIIMLFAINLRNKKLNILAATIPLMLTILVCVAGPYNGWYFRYLFPIALCLPYIFGMYFGGW